MLWSSKLNEFAKTPKHILKIYQHEALVFLRILQDSPAPLIGKSCLLYHIYPDIDVFIL